jgi:hypothetical protein
MAASLRLILPKGDQFILLLSVYQTAKLHVADVLAAADAEGQLCVTPA